MAKWVPHHTLDHVMCLNIELDFFDLSFHIGLTSSGKWFIMNPIGLSTKHSGKEYNSFEDAQQVCYDSLRSCIGTLEGVTDGNETKEFAFEFVNEEDGYDRYTIEVTGTNLQKEFDKFICSDAFIDFTCDMEDKYGVHDFSCSPCFEVAGFASYEIEQDHRVEVFDKWVKFIESNGFTCGEQSFIFCNDEEKDE